jgi:hypothetical protein
MLLSRLQQPFTLVLLIALSISCVTQTVPSLPTVTSPPQGEPTDSPSTTPPASQPTQSSRRLPRATGDPSNNQSSEASQNLPLDVPTHPIDAILSRPTQHSITVSVLAYQDFEGFIEYGVSPDKYSNQTPLCVFIANQPVEILIDSLQANVSYTYRLRFREANAYEFTATKPETFHTQRTTENTFIFTVQADSHLDSNSNLQVYLQTLANEYADQPDFQIDLGDTFMTDKYKPYTDVQAQYLAQRYYLSLIGQSAPLFLVLGNHDGEAAPRDGSENEMSIWSTQMRTQYFPNPVPDDFYTGNTALNKKVGALQDYYAWEWGDALFIVLDPYWFTPPQKGTTDLWNRTLGEAQYQWLKTTLETSRAKWKFVFIHQLVSGVDKNGRGGVEVASFYEWGGNNADGSWGFDQQRPGWPMPIHQLLVANHVTTVFHGHDHLFVKQDLDNIIYQEVPQPSATRSDSINSATDYGYMSGEILGSSGYLRVTVTPTEVTVEYVRTYLLKDEKPDQQNGQVDYIYVINNDPFP